MQQHLSVFSNIKLYIYSTKLSCSKPSLPCLKIPECLMHLQHIAYHIKERTHTLSMLKIRVVLRPKGEPVIGPPSWTKIIQSTNSHSTSIVCSLIFSSQTVPRSSKQCILFRVYQTKILYTFLDLKVVCWEHAHTICAVTWKMWTLQKF